MATWWCILNSLAIALSIEMLDQLSRVCLFHVLISFSWLEDWLIERRSEPPGATDFDGLMPSVAGQPADSRNESSQTRTFLSPFVSPSATLICL